MRSEDVLVVVILAVIVTAAVVGSFAPLILYASGVVSFEVAVLFVLSMILFIGGPASA